MMEYRLRLTGNHLKIIEAEMNRLIPLRNLIREAINMTRENMLAPARVALSEFQRLMDIQPCTVCTVVHDLGGDPVNPWYKCCPAYEACYMFVYGKNWYTTLVSFVQDWLRGRRKVTPEELDGGHLNNLEQTLRFLDVVIKKVEKRMKRIEKREKK